MSEQILAMLKGKLDATSIPAGIGADTRRNILKEELQMYVLNFIYHHPLYSKWVMYGGSALRIIHGLDRMSVDLDFEVPHPVTGEFLEKLKKEIEEYFTRSYGARSDFLVVKITGKRGVTLKFSVGKEFGFDAHDSLRVHLKIDLNHFVAPNTVIDRRPINRNQLSFVIATYTMSTLMASKIAAIFLCGTRGVGDAKDAEKGRDIYDLLWYMDKKVAPDFEYLVAKGVEVRDLRSLFDKLTLQMNKVSDENLRQDLIPLFLNRNFIENWLSNWRESYLQYFREYKIRTIIGLDHIVIDQDFYTDNYTFIFFYRAEDNSMVRILYTISDYWITFTEGDLPIDIDESVASTIIPSSRRSPHPEPSDRLKKYATLFHRKTEEYFKKTNNVMLGDRIATKVIRMTAVNFNPRDQIVLTPLALLSCGLNDLLQ